MIHVWMITSIILFSLLLIVSWGTLFYLFFSFSLSLSRTLEFLFFFLDICTIYLTVECQQLEWVCITGLVCQTKRSWWWWNKLLKTQMQQRKKKNTKHNVIRAEAIITDTENSVLKDECWNWWVFGNNKNSTWMLFHFDLILFLLSDTFRHLFFFLRFAFISFLSSDHPLILSVLFSIVRYFKQNVLFVKKKCTKCCPSAAVSRIKLEIKPEIKISICSGCTCSDF